MSGKQIYNSNDNMIKVFIAKLKYNLIIKKMYTKIPKEKLYKWRGPMNIYQYVLKFINLLVCSLANKGKKWNR